MAAGLRSELLKASGLEPLLAEHTSMAVLVGTRKGGGLPGHWHSNSMAKEVSNLRCASNIFAGGNVTVRILLGAGPGAIALQQMQGHGSGHMHWHCMRCITCSCCAYIRHLTPRSLTEHALHCLVYAAAVVHLDMHSRVRATSMHTRAHPAGVLLAAGGCCCLL